MHKRTKSRFKSILIALAISLYSLMVKMDLKGYFVRFAKKSKIYINPLDNCQ